MIYATDMYCGGGGTSAGLLDAADELGETVNLLAINHWDVAIATHKRNHQMATHLCESLDNVNPRHVIKRGRLDLLVASPECTHFSNARGGKPCSEQSRASAWHIMRWAEALRIDNIIIENVREFMNWGPLGVNGKPLKSKKGETYRGFLTALASLGYNVEDRVLNAADYGDPTARRRLFILAKRGNKKITWPEPTHGPECSQPYRTAREIIDWDYPSKSIFDRKRPLAPNTIRRIEAGLAKFGGGPFLATLRGGGSRASAQSVDKPTPTVSANGTHIGVCQPYLVNMKGCSNASSIDKPVPTQTAHASHLYLCEPFVMHTTHHGNDESRCHSIQDPVPCVTGAHRGEMALIEPFILHQMEAGGCKSVEQPLPTITTRCGHALVEPFITKYYGTGSAKSVDAPLDTVTTKPRFGLVEPKLEGYTIDIHFRMLQPHELAAAMSLGDMSFCGNKGDKVKQIGNAVARQQAKALCKAMLS